MPTKPKMLYASTKDTVKKAFDITFDVQGNDFDDISEANFASKVK